MKTKSNFKRTRHPFGGLGFAGLLIIAGALLLSVKLDFIPAKYGDVIISWQMLLIVLGLGSLLRKHIIGAITLISIGVFFMIPELGKVSGNFIGVVPDNFKELYWPALLIVAGVVFFLRRFIPHPRQHDFHERMHERMQYHQMYYSQKRGNYCHEVVDGYVEKNCVFNSGEHIVLDPEFKGGEINTVFGETRLDLRKTNLPEGKSNLEVNIVFGSVIIFVPEDWVVQVNVDQVFGSFQDKRFNKAESGDRTKILVVNGSIVFGGGELRN